MEVSGGIGREGWRTLSGGQWREMLRRLEMLRGGGGWEGGGGETEGVMSGGD
ncbi:unnamed protein product [Staurois parvus]|uniref:Uncharacterized protein n=1 Tax=Staurois parvus TaxID=386267 RepID=A0ABN9ELR8_9NEOB|nr:unnamed protein product [Staurois parvus]